MDEMDEKNTGVTRAGSWTGCAVLFLCSMCPKINLLELYKHQRKKFSVFKAIKLTLTDSAGGLEGYEILKLHDAEPLLGVEVKFVDQAVCRRFLESYSTGLVRELLSQHTSQVLTHAHNVPIETQLKAGKRILDHCLEDLDLCLQQIQQSQPVRLRDDEVAELEEQLQSLAVGHTLSPQTLQLGNPLVPSNCFLFQRKVFDDRQLTPADHQRFASIIGVEWKRVGRALQKTCRALKSPAIENLAYEYAREGLYEQAYQLLSRFIQSEGKGARLSRLVLALEESKLTAIAEIMLDIQAIE